MRCRKRFLIQKSRLYLENETVWILTTIYVWIMQLQSIWKAPVNFFYWIRLTTWKSDATRFYYFVFISIISNPIITNIHTRGKRRFSAPKYGRRCWTDTEMLSRYGSTGCSGSVLSLSVNMHFLENFQWICLIFTGIE